MSEKTEANPVETGRTASALSISSEPFYEIRKIRIEHGSTRSRLHGFVGASADMAIRMERVLFWNLGRQIRESGLPTGWIQQVEVPERWQGQGIGSSLIEEAIRTMEAAGIQEVYLDACPADRNRFNDLVSFYERHGFLAAPDCGEDQYPPPFIMKADLRRLE